MMIVVILVIIKYFILITRSVQLKIHPNPSGGRTPPDP